MHRDQNENENKNKLRQSQNENKRGFLGAFYGSFYLTKALVDPTSRLRQAVYLSCPTHSVEAIYLHMTDQVAALRAA